MKKLILLLTSILAILACTAKINESITVEPNSKVNKDLNTVNGNIVIGENSIINGDLRSINGRIELGAHSQVEDIKTVNGEVWIDEGARVLEGITVINGSVTIKPQAVVTKDVSAINGSIRLARARVLGDVKTTNGDIFLEHRSQILGSIVIKGKSKEQDKRKVEIFIRDSSRVKRSIENQSNHTKVVVYLDGTSGIDGDVIQAELVYEK